MSPWSKSHTDNTSPDLSLAEVPPIVAAFFETYSIVFLEFNLIFLIIYTTTKDVMILVKEAISLLSFSHFPKRISPVLPSMMPQLFAVTKGGARSTNNLWTNIFTNSIF
jgi:hypothetical protein